MNEARVAAALALFVLLSACAKEKQGEGSPETPAETKPTPTAKQQKVPAGEKSGTDEDTIRGEEVSYEAGGVTLKGYLAFDGAKTGPRPGVLVVHEWWGHNDYARKRARMLAAMGYTALAVDMYGDGKQASHPDDAKKFMMAVMEDMEAGIARFEAAKKLLEGHETTDPSKTAAIGYCFGGGVVLQMARTGMDLDAVASFHGSLGTKTPAKKGAIKANILVLHGAADPFVPQEQVTAFKEEMAKAGAQMEFHAYEGAKHAFTNPGATELGKKFSLPLEYQEKADKESWAQLDGFLKKTFSSAP